MAAPPIFKPGTRQGHCLDACKHEECTEMRRIARKVCVHCSHPVGYGQPFTRVDIEPSATALDDQEFAHARCHERWIDNDALGLSESYDVFGPDTDGHPIHFD